jgi:hypothetical protein
MNGWETVIADAEEELRKLARRRMRLKASLRAFRQHLENGDPLPDGLAAFEIKTTQPQPTGNDQKSPK